MTISSAKSEEQRPIGVSAEAIVEIEPTAPPNDGPYRGFVRRGSVRTRALLPNAARSLIDAFHNTNTTGASPMALLDDLNDAGWMRFSGPEKKE